MSDTSAALPSIRPRGPDFVGVGIQKSGTTWVGWILEQHPEVLMRKKEISFFVRYFHRGWKWYESWFEDKGQRRAGELSVNYIDSPRPDFTHREFYPKWNPRRRLLFWRRYPSARDELATRYPGLRVFAVFRNPIDRAWSHYWYWRERRERNHKRVVPFEQMFEEDGRWIRTQGYYADLLSFWRERFPDLRAYFYDDIRTAPERLARELYEFIGVDPQFQPELGRRVNPGRYTPMPPATATLLRDTYSEQIERFAAMTGRDLGHWLEVSAAAATATQADS